MNCYEPCTPWTNRAYLEAFRTSVPPNDTAVIESKLPQMETLPSLKLSAGLASVATEDERRKEETNARGSPTDSSRKWSAGSVNAPTKVKRGWRGLAHSSSGQADHLCRVMCQASRDRRSALRGVGWWVGWRQLGPSLFFRMC